MTFKTISVSRADRITTVALDRPAQMNATNALMERELCEFFTDINHCPDTNAVIITGNGKAFCGGGDFEYIRELMDNPEKIYDSLPWGKRLIFSILECSKPIIAKINGHAMGLGATIALFCDVTFASEKALIADPHVAIGFVAGDGGAVIWPQLVGYNRAKEYLFTGEPLTGKDAERIGLINHAVAPENLDATVQAYADKVAKMPKRAVQWTKASVNIGLKQIAHSIMDASLAYEALSNSTTEHREAVDAMEARIKGKA